jgi:hypothetical protein
VEFGANLGAKLGGRGMIEDKVLTLAATLNRQELIKALRKEAITAQDRASSAIEGEGPSRQEEQQDVERYKRVIAFLETERPLRSVADEVDRSLCEDIRASLEARGAW